MSSFHPDRGCHPRHRWDRDDDLRGWLPQPLCHRHSPGGGLGLHVRPLQGRRGEQALWAVAGGKGRPRRGWPVALGGRLMEPGLEDEQLFPRSAGHTKPRPAETHSSSQPWLSRPFHQWLYICSVWDKTGGTMDWLSPIGDFLVWQGLEKDPGP